MHIYSHLRGHVAQVMFGCLMKFAVKCGREDLSETLFHAAQGQPQGNDTQNYMWLIRSAGQKRDVHKAVALLRQLQSQAWQLAVESSASLEARSLRSFGGEPSGRGDLQLRLGRVHEQQRAGDGGASL